MEPVRVLHETVVMDPGGIETLLMNVYRHIDRDKVRFDFMVHRPERGFYEDEIEQLGGRVYRTPRFSPFPGAYRRYRDGVERILREHPEYQVLHAHAELNLWPLMIAKELGVPTRIAHSHNARPRFGLKYCFFLYEKLRIKRYCTDRFMCSVPAGEWTFGGKAVADGRCVWIRNGIETEKFAFDETVRARKRRELGLGGRFAVGHVGRFMKQKNHAFLLEIFSEIQKRRPDSVLLLAGEGRLMDEIRRRAARLGLADRVMFLGNRGDVNELMQAMDVFLLPSLWEGLPLTGIEAQTAGLPVILSDVITDEVRVTDQVRMVSLKQPAGVWADRALAACGDGGRTDARQQVVDAGFDVRTTARWLQEFYLERYGRRP